MSYEPGSVQFPLVPNTPEVRARVRVCFATNLIALAFLLALLVAGEMHWESAAITAPGLVLMAFLHAWSAPLMSKGVARLDAERILVKTRASKHVYRWAHVADVRLTTLAEYARGGTTWAWIAGADPNEPLVEIHLERSHRVGLWPLHYGTDVIGLPTVVVRRIPLFVDDPKGFVEHAQRYLARG
jgi:hypothetical protein